MSVITLSSGYKFPTCVFTIWFTKYAYLENRGCISVYLQCIYNTAVFTVKVMVCPDFRGFSLSLLPPPRGGGPGSASRSHLTLWSTSRSVASGLRTLALCAHTSR